MRIDAYHPFHAEPMFEKLVDSGCRISASACAKCRRSTTSIIRRKIVDTFPDYAQILSFADAAARSRSPKATAPRSRNMPG